MTTDRERGTNPSTGPTHSGEVLAPRAIGDKRAVVGHTFGRYEGLLRLAAGGMGQVVVARVQSERGVRRLVAIKTILSHLTDNDLFLKMFVREAEIASRLHHPNVVPVLELGRTETEHFLVMEYFPSMPLNAVLRESLKRDRPMPIDVAAAIISDAAGGLHAAHELTDDDGHLVHLVHRDATPSNLLVGLDGSVKLTDFGVAKATGAQFENMTVSGDLRGKIGYLSPEQVTGEVIDRRSDIFTLGIVLWECIAGKRLFGRKDSEVAAIRALMDEPIPDLRDVVPKCPEALARIVSRALERDRNRRYQTAAELRQALTTQVLGSTDLSRVAFAKETIGEPLAERQRAIAAAVAELDSPSSQARKLASAPHEDPGGPRSKPSLASMGSGPAVAAMTVPPEQPSSRAAKPVALALAAVAVVAVAGFALRPSQPRTSAAPPVTQSRRVAAREPDPPAVQPAITVTADASVVASAAEVDAGSTVAAVTAVEADAGSPTAETAARPRARTRARGASGATATTPATTPATTVTTARDPERIEM